MNGQTAEPGFVPALRALVAPDFGPESVAHDLGHLGLKREPIWVPGESVSEVYTPGACVSVVQHFREKLLRLSRDVRTATGQRIAARRHEVIVRYLDELAGELGAPAGANEAAGDRR